MSNLKPQEDFDIFTTADGSPTISLLGGEKMHSLDGALSESLFIYGQCIENILDLPRSSVLSMGLGLGYNELMALGYFQKKNVTDFHLVSFEKVSFLRQSFLSWINGLEKLLASDSNLLQDHLEGFKNSPPKNSLFECYNQILFSLADHFSINPNQYFQFLLESLKSEKFMLLNELTEKNINHFKFNAIFYDAFSGNTDSPLWTQDHLENFIEQYCSEVCTFSTYAATGNLRRALTKNGFKVELQKGFGKKRQSTFAVR